MPNELALIGTPSSTYRRYQKSFNLLLSVCLIAVVSGCAILHRGGSTPSGAVKIDSVRKAAPANLLMVPFTVRFDEFRKAESNPEINRMRIVKIATSPSATGDDPNPQYRLFDIQKGSVAQLLGLENADVLVAANGYVVFHPDQFMRYLSGLPVKEGTFIEIRRDGRPIQLEYKFIGEDPWQKSGGPPADAVLPPPVETAPETSVSARPTLLPVLNNSEDEELETRLTPVPVPTKEAKKTAKPTPAVAAKQKKVKPTPTPVKKAKSSKKRK